MVAIDLARFAPFVLGMNRGRDLRYGASGRVRQARPWPATLRPPAPGAERTTARALLELASTSYGEWPDFIRHVVQFDADVLQIERVTFWSFGDDGSTLHCDAGYVAPTRTFERGSTLLESDHGAYFAALREARVLRVEDVSADPRTRGMQDYFAIREIVSILNVPVWVDGRLAGVLCHEHSRSRRRWTAGDEDFATGAGQVVASALAARAQTRAEAAAGRAAFLDSVSRRLLESLSAREIAGRTVALVVSRFADFAMIWTRDRHRALEALASTHADPRLRSLVEEIARGIVAGPRPRGLTYVLGQRQAILYGDVSLADLQRLGDAQRERLTQLGLRSAMFVPLAFAGRTIGVMALFATSRHYRGEDLGLAEEVAERVAAALENARLYEVARRAVAARDEFLSLAAHELRTPLTALQLVADGAVRHGLQGATEGGDDPLSRQVRRLAALVEHMLDAARIRTGGLALQLEPCDLRTLVEERVANAAPRALRGGGAINVRAEAPALGRWDCARLAQVIDELLDNALKFGRNRPIEVALESNGADAVLTVADHGVGIPPDRLPSIFSPFERAVDREHFGGLGLGLHIGKAIVEAHGGSIEVQSTMGRGTTFVLRLPRGRTDE